MREADTVADIVYVLINQAMPNYTKIGRTNNLKQRLQQLHNTSVPLPFECVYAARVKDGIFVERQLHDAFANDRVSSKREFFEIAPERVVSALKLAELEDVTPNQDYVEDKEDQIALNHAKERRNAFNFAMVDIPVGAVLTFSRNLDVTCRVLDKRNVEFEGEKVSLSASALKLLQDMGYNWKTVAGPDFWLFEGEPLSERRRRMEESE